MLAFITKITNNNNRIEFEQYDAGYKFTVSRMVHDRLYRMQLMITHAMIHESRPEVDIWEMLYNQITEEMNVVMSKPYDKNESREMKLVSYVKDFIKDHQISCDEAVYQCDSIQLEAPDFLSKCCEIIGYYEYEDDKE